MRASELIRILQESIKKYGDRVVMTYDPDFGDTMPIESVSIDVPGDEFVLEIDA